jgi:hypothetical protein
MSSSVTGEVRKIEFKKFNLSASVERLLAFANTNSNDQPIDATLLAESIVTLSANLKAGNKSEAFEWLASRLKAQRRFENKSSSKLSPVSLDSNLARSFAISEVFFNKVKEVWGRDIVTMVLLTDKDSRLENLVQQNGTKLTALREEWFQFVTRDNYHLKYEEWALWWKQAGFNPSPGEVAKSDLTKVSESSSQKNTTPSQSSSRETGSRSQPPVASEPIDIFLSFSMDEILAVRKVKEFLTASGFKMGVWDEKRLETSNWVREENARLDSAKVVLVFLGAKGWGPIHVQQAESAARLRKQVLPVLIGNPKKSDLAKLRYLFPKSEILELDIANDSNLQQLVGRIALLGVTAPGIGDTKQTLPNIEAERKNTAATAPIIQTIVNGDNKDRYDLLTTLKKVDNINRVQLSAALREAIQKYSLDPEKSNSTAFRAPEETPAIRSWLISALVICHEASPENKKLLLRYLDPKTEPSDYVRFWNLAGVYAQKVPWLEEAIEVCSNHKSDPSNTVLLLAQLAGRQQDLNMLREMLFLSNDERKWSILRALRIVAIPEMVPDLCKFLTTVEDTKPLAYDAFYALIHPEIILLSSKNLQEHFTVEAIIRKLCTVLLESDHNGKSNFATLLLCFDESTVNVQLESLKQDAELAQVAVELENVLDVLRPKQLFELSDAGFSSDIINVKNDFLGIEVDVKTLTAVMLSRDVEPPLAIGLFGDWGYGKSFFMDSIKNEVEKVRIAPNYSEAKFCKDTVQINFNAWHYVDANLWASLVSHILSELSTYVSPEPSLEEKQTKFIEELKSSQGIVKEVQAQKAIAQKEIEDKQRLLRESQAKREKKKIELRELNPDDIYKLLGDKEQKAITSVLSDLGVPGLVKSVSDLESAIKETSTTSGRIISLFLSLFRSTNAFILIGLLITVMVLIPWAIEYVNKTASFKDLIGEAGKQIANFAALLTTISVIIKKSLTHVNSCVSRISEYKEKAEKLLAEKRLQPSADEEKLQKEINDLAAREVEIQMVLDSAAKRVAELEERIRLIREERSLGRFLTERVKSDDYRKHLGLISTIREDFESLTKKLSQAHLETAALDSSQPKFRKVDRIILYIDDLDRCPANKVLDVLQAVHLLLAFKLFVVVVGVDPRWLLHSLATQFTAFQNHEQNRKTSVEGEEWETTPQNFLEKIFQIQFSLQPMSSTGYKKLIKNLLSNKSSSAILARKGDGVAESKPSELANVERATGAETKPEVPAQETPDNVKLKEKGRELNLIPKMVEDPIEEKRQVSQPESSTQEKFVIDDDALLIRDWEVAYAETLFTLIPSPRGAKRFSNVYRLLKAAVLKKDREKFEGVANIPGDFQVPMLLLALVTGAPEDAVKLFPKLQSLLELKSIKEALKELARESNGSDKSHSTMIDNISKLVNTPNFKDDVELFKYWIPRVSRFSFDLSRILTKEETAG